MSTPLPWLPGVTAEQLFNSFNLILPGWVALIVAPRWRRTQGIVLAAAAVVGVIYTALFGQSLYTNGVAKVYSQFFTYHGVVELFSDPHAVVAGWLHYAVADLLSACFMVRDAADRGAPTLFLSLLAAASLAIPPPMVLLPYLLLARPLLRARRPAPAGAAMSSADLKED